MVIFNLKSILSFYLLKGKNVKSNQMVSQCINELMDTVIKLEKVTNIPQKLDALEGRRFLLRMLSASVDAFVEHIDTDRPQFRHSESPHRKMFGDCPDADYLQAPIDLRDGRTYQLIGKIPKGTNYIGVMLYGKAGRIGVCKTDEQLNVDSDGNHLLVQKGRLHTKFKQRKSWKGVAGGRDKEKIL